MSHIIFHNTSNKAWKGTTCFGSYDMSIQNKKVILIQNEQDIHGHGHVLGFPNPKSSAILQALLFLLLSSITLTLSTKVRNFL